MISRNLIVREESRKILIDITFEVPNRIVINRGRFLRNGVELIVQPEKVVIMNNQATFSGIVVKNIYGGVLIGPHEEPISAIIKVLKVPRCHKEII